MLNTTKAEEPSGSSPFQLPITTRAFVATEQMIFTPHKGRDDAINPQLCSLGISLAK